VCCRLLALNPKFAVAYFNRGVIYYGRDDYDSAIADADQAIRLDPENTDACVNRGKARGRKNDPDHAIADFEQVLKFRPWFGEALQVASACRCCPPENSTRLVSDPCARPLYRQIEYFPER
jgi:tetratricopeptide (TPR) repeat protein